MSLIKTWAPQFQSAVRMRGRAYFLSGRVHRIDPQPGELVRAEVRGTQNYTVTLSGEGTGMEAQCTCAFSAGGSYCKHIWATILDLHHHPVDAARAAAASPSDEEESSTGHGPRPPKARRRGDGASTTRSREPEWIGRLTLLRPPVVNTDPAAPPIAVGDRQVCYCISSELSARHNGLVIMLRQRDPTQTGWSKARRLKITAGSLDELHDPVDRELCALLLGASYVDDETGSVSFGNRALHDSFRLPRGAWSTLLNRMIATQRCFLDDSEADREPLTWDGPEPWVLWMVGTSGADELLITTELRRGEQYMPIDEPELILSGSDGLVVSDGKVAPFDDRGAGKWVSQFRDDWRFGNRSAPIKVPAVDLERFFDRLYRLSNLPEIDLPEGIGRLERRVAPVPHVELFSTSESLTPGDGATRNQLVARVWFEYEDQRVAPGQPGRFVSESGPVAAAKPVEPQSADENNEENTDGEAGESLSVPATGLIRRDLKAERDALVHLVSLGFRHNPHNGREGWSGFLAVKLMPGVVADLLHRGWKVSADQHVLRTPRAPRLSITSGIDWFELHGGFRFDTANGEQVVGLPQILAAAKSGRRMVSLDDGSEGLLPDEWLRDHGLLAHVASAFGDHLRFKSTQAALLDSLLRDTPLDSVDHAFEEARQRLRQFDGVRPVDPSPQFQGSLRTYQREGLGWLEFLRWFGMGGVLADDMGLGKTVQVLALLDRLYNSEGSGDEKKNGNGNGEGKQPPSLIVVPRSVVFNWIDEARQFAPHLRVQAYTGADRESLRGAFADHHVIVTSYGLMRRDIAELGKHRFLYVILDEAQAIKNPSSQSAKAARVLDSRHRLALTGTPVENHLGDLWSIFEYLNPGMLGSATTFGNLVRGGIEPSADGKAPRAATDAATAAQVARAMRPFILRRTKKQVLTELPDKTEQTIMCQLEPDQRKIYDQLRLHYRQALLGDQGRGEGAPVPARNSKSPMMVLEALLRLRQAACHPGLIDPRHADEASAKLDVLLDRLSDIIEEGHKALVFSQFTSMLALVRRRLDERGIVYEYLDGQTRHRRAHVQRFQTDPACPLFLISLKAGGLGLNLTAAEYVFILDPWWNPAVEAQAIDRIHRIGQTRHVFAYRLICEDTVEQRIVELQAKKKKLADAIVGEQQNILAGLTRDELDRLLS
ncbi:MAG: DEAD/DEAH box helicase [Planctomycetes bacterium]|nr:DEAD/DEAH box helicase [Planctomycetota bacterium]